MQVARCKRRDASGEGVDQQGDAWAQDAYMGWRLRMWNKNKLENAYVVRYESEN